MNTYLRWSVFTLSLATWAFLASGCIMADGGGGYGYDDGMVGSGYYESFGVEYGGWGPGYHVAPYRGGHDRGDEHHRDGGERRPSGTVQPSIGGHEGGGGRQGGHSYRPAAGTRAMPSLPSRGNQGGPGRNR